MKTQTRKISVFGHFSHSERHWEQSHKNDDQNKLLFMIIPVDHEEAKNLKQTQYKEKKNRKRI